MERWLDIPVPLLRAYADMLPKLEAERRITARTDAALAFGSIAQGDAERIMRELDRIAGGRKARPASQAELAQIGIGVRNE